MPRPRDADGMFWVTVASGGTILAAEGTRAYVRAGPDVVLVERNDGTLIVTRVGKVMARERIAIVRNRMKKAGGG